jgi:hypothetical protein
MVLRLLTLPFRIVGFLFSFAFTVAIVEGFGLFGYLQWQHPGAIESVLADGVTVGEVRGLLLGRVDVLAVAVVLFFLAVALVLKSDSGSTSHRTTWGGDDEGGGFGGFADDGGGGGFGGDGGGGGGDGGGGGGGGE